MTKKQEFETELLTLCDKHDVEADNMGKDFFTDVWQWIEQQLKEARVEELRKIEATIEVCTDKKIGVFMPLLEAIENRIKELTGE